MAVFVINDRIRVNVKATKLVYKNDSVLAYWNGECSAVFRMSEIMGCYLEPMPIL